jgi:hypothetical protein
MFSRWWILRESIRAGISAFRTTRGILSAAPTPCGNPLDTGKALQGFYATVRGQMSAAGGENAPLLHLMDATFDYLSSNSPKVPPPAVPEGENAVPFPGPGRGGENRIH